MRFPVRHHSELLTDLGGKIRVMRLDREMTLRDPARQSRLSMRFVSDVEAGRANISVLKLAQIADALGVRPHELLVSFFPPKRGVIALLGLRGAGKSTVGRALAEKLDLPFYELDKLVEAEAGMGLSEIFGIHGEVYFRHAEFDALKKFFAAHKEAVLATGGGVVDHGESSRLLFERANTIWLKAAPEEHWNRVVHQGDLRPMQNRPYAMAELKRRLREREPQYSRATLVIQTSGKTVAQVVNEIARQVLSSKGKRQVLPGI